MFVFGSSLVDNGNNNNLIDAIAKADYLPYGIDFPGGASGRFTNGKNVIDLLGQHLQLPAYIPPFTHPSTRGPNIVHGVNYASGGSGILDDTGAVLGNVICLNKQVEKFEHVTVPELELQLDNKAQQLLQNYLFVVSSGGNDYSFNYFLGLPNANLTLQAFTSHLTTTLSHQLKRLYKLGARKFVVMSLNPNGCSPSAKARNPRRSGCIQYLNRAAHLFNHNLRTLVDAILPEMPASNIVFVNAYKVIRDIIKNPASNGFVDANNACCEVPSIDEGGNGILCKKGGSICANRSNHVFFDGLHPTEAVNAVIARKAYTSIRKTEVYPMNVKQLSQI
nr:GDSL esterase/lipase At1g29670-like [Ipomoea batatas]